MVSRSGTAVAPSSSLAKIFAATGPAAASAVIEASRRKKVHPGGRPYSIQKDIFKAVVEKFFKVDLADICAKR